ncbi:MAG TPA: hypothetical protein VGZ68_00820 [Acidimicrobiales bacterium]|nr:hypothetical protein [Acidimicrobiales bacterium]
MRTFDKTEGGEDEKLMTPRVRSTNVQRATPTLYSGAWVRESECGRLALAPGTKRSDVESTAATANACRTLQEG